MVAAHVVPFTTREQLAEQLLRARSNAASFVRQSYSPGTYGTPLRWLDTRDDLAWRARAWRATLEANGVTQKDRILHALPSSSAVARDCWSAALELGALSMGTQQVSVDDVLQFAPTVLVSTPTDALRLAQATGERRVELAEGSLSLVVITGEAGGSIGSTRRRIEEQFGARCLDVYHLVEAGVVGWGCTVGDAIHLNEDEFAIESIEPHGDGPVDDGHLGELVLTTRTERGTPPKAECVVG